MKNNQTTTNETTTEEAIINPFVFDEAVSENVSRKLDHTSQLIGCANTRATELMKAISTDRTDLIGLANDMMNNGDRDDLMELILSVYTPEDIHADAIDALDGAENAELDRLLESRRSDRSKAKKKGIKSNVSTCRTYISAMYAELMIRDITGKALSDSNQSSEIDMEALAGDLDAISKKVKSLQTKKCRLAKLADYDAQAKLELEMVNADIARLNALRPNTRVTSTTAVKSIPIDTLRDALSKLDTTDLPAEMLELIAKLG